MITKLLAKSRNLKRRIEHRLRPIDWDDQASPMFSATNIHYEIAEKTRGVDVGGIPIPFRIRGGTVRDAVCALPSGMRAPTFDWKRGQRIGEAGKPGPPSGERGGIYLVIRSVHGGPHPTCRRPHQTHRRNAG